MRARTPCRASSAAASRPDGPAPTIRTGTRALSLTPISTPRYTTLRVSSEDPAGGPATLRGMARYHLRQVGIDVGDLDAMISFWSAALGYELHHREAGYAVLHDPGAAEPRIFLQQVPEAKVAKNRVHMDLEVPDESAAVSRLTGLGARVLWREDFGTHYWTVLADPEGNEFCVGHFG